MALRLQNTPVDCLFTQYERGRYKYTPPSHNGTLSLGQHPGRGTYAEPDWGLVQAHYPKDVLEAFNKGRLARLGITIECEHTYFYAAPLVLQIRAEETGTDVRWAIRCSHATVVSLMSLLSGREFLPRLISIHTFGEPGYNYGRITVKCLTATYTVEEPDLEASVGSPIYPHVGGVLYPSREPDSSMPVYPYCHE